MYFVEQLYYKIHRCKFQIESKEMARSYRGKFSLTVVRIYLIYHYFRSSC